MSNTVDSVFNREFKEMMNARKAKVTGFALSSITMPDFSELTKTEGLFVGNRKLKVALIRKIDEPFFERLNNTEVELIGKTKLLKRQVLSDGTFRKDKNGNYVADDIVVPHTCIAILSTISIGLKRFIEKDGRKIEHRTSEGYRYVDYVETSNGRKYIYVVPREKVYRLDMNALALSFNKHRNYYRASKIALQNGHYIYMYVMPYSYRDNISSHIIGLKASTNFNKEVDVLLKHWLKEGVIFPTDLTQLKDQISGTTNIGFMEYEGTLLEDDYKRYTVSLAEEKDLNLEEG